MAYKKLLLSTQGGIVDKIHRSSQDNCAVLSIGLGGTGCDCLRNLKAKVFNRVNPDDDSKTIPEYKHVKFLAVDTDKGSFTIENDKHTDIDKIDIDTEFFDLSYEGNINDIFEKNAQTLSRKGEYKEWLRFEDIRVAAAKAGACGVRQIGRYLLMTKAGEFMNRVRNSISDAKRGLNSPKVYVHIFAGIGGGTGAGTFLDVCYLVQKALENEGVNAFVLGYFFLPDVNLAKGLDTETERYVRINGYASLQELDYFMNVDRNKDKWSQRYPDVGLIETRKPPVDIAHLISGHNAKGDTLKNGYDYAMNVVTDYFMDFLIKSSDGFTMESHIANYNARKAMLNKDSGANYEYCILGASNATLPYKEVLTYLSAYLFTSMADINKNLANQGDCDSFVKSTGLTYQNLFQMALGGANLAFPKPNNRPKDAFENDDLVTKYFTDLRAQAVNAVSRNLSTMGRDIEMRDTTNAHGGAGISRNNVHASSIITKIFNALNEIVSNPEKGPYFASSLINGTSGTDLVSLIDGHIVEVQSKIDQLEFNLEKYETKRKQTQNAFFGSGNALTLGRRYKDYELASQNLIRQYTEQEIFYAFKAFLNTLRKQLVDLSTGYYRLYCNIVTELCNTFSANVSYLEEMIDKKYDYENPIVRLNEIKETIDYYLKEHFDLPSEFTKFHKHMLSPEGYAMWNENREDKITKLISAYFAGIFSEYTNKSMIQYLQEKYNTQDTDTIIKKVRDDILGNLDTKATPLFWTEQAFYSVSGASKIGYITVPAECEEVVMAAEKLQGAKKQGDNEQVTVRKSFVKDRITIMRCLVGAPAFGYQPIQQYENASISDTEIKGKHYFEGKSYLDETEQFVTGRDWRLLPSPVPLSKMNVDSAPDLVKLAKKRKEIYLKAEEISIIQSDNAGEYFIKLIDDAFMEDIRGIASKAKAKGDNISLYEASTKIAAMKNEIQYSSVKIQIPNDAKNGDTPVPEDEKKAVRIDHFVSMPIVVAIVEEELGKYEELEKTISDLQPKIDNDFEDFCNVLFTGAITIKEVMVVFEDSFYNEVKLSAPNMPMGGIRLYQAFQSFKELNENEKSKLIEIAQHRNNMEEGMDCIIAACAKVKEQLSKASVATALRIAASKFTPIASEIKGFYDDLSSRFEEYTMTYGI